MAVFRRRLSLIGLVLLLFQAAGFAMAPVASCCASMTQTSDDDDDCCKGLAPGQMCPLHHHRVPSNGSSQQHDDSGGATLRCGCSTTDPALLSLAYGLGVMPAPISVDVIPVSIVVAFGDESASTIPHRIESPPPRV
jgi:hypothetical protein